ncbi:MAG: hemolysin III family protein, partial [Sulfitobacter sp.]
MNTNRDTFADGFVHVAGLAFSLPATAVLLHSTQDTPLLFLATAVYCASMVTAFGASLLYHLSPVARFEAVLGRIDHAAIYLKIAGTYTPFVVLIGSALAYTLLAVVWLIALIGVVAKLRGWAADARGSLALYLGMGWLSVLLVVPMW